jgi:hypothetical protein
MVARGGGGDNLKYWQTKNFKISHAIRRRVADMCLVVSEGFT